LSGLLKADKNDYLFTAITSPDMTVILLYGWSALPGFVFSQGFGNIIMKFILTSVRGNVDFFSRLGNPFPEVLSQPVTWVLYFSILAGLVVLFFRYRTRSLRKTNQILREKEKIAQEVLRQRDRLAVAMKNLTDSIRYAQKIQQALLPSDYYFKRLLPASFILFIPRDIVSGDFYWINEKNGKVFFTAADCTGHGVPGALMSMIGFQMLDKIINDQEVETPSEILNILNQGIATTFSRGEESILLKDGMDLSFCTLERKMNTLEFAGAFNALYLVRDNNLLQYKGDRVSVGLGEEENQRFSNHRIELQEGDKIYLFSDGYADQFGGPNGKKFMYRRFRHLLLSIADMPMHRQKEFIYETFLSWKGDLEQVDDILIIGVEPLKNNTSQ